MSAYSEYSLNIAIAEFFSQTYSIYAGPEFEFVIQFRLKSLILESETVTHGKEPLFVYIMNRIQGISYLDFVLTDCFSENSDKNFIWRKTLMSDVARFFTLSWEAPQEVNSDYRENLRRTYTKDLQLLLHCLPQRFHQIIRKCLDSMDAFLSLPMALLHRDFAICDIMNLHSLQALTGALHLKNGWRRFEGYEALPDTFSSTFQDQVGNLSAESMKTINTARIIGLLRSRGFTKRVVNMRPATSIRDDETGRYNMIYLDSFLVNQTHSGYKVR
ncbi:hypothetical protein NA56DRAFT_681373 [Hyaloscypha hepaticicola]|uniref:Uncharacterized protein n=1 Tax=Hyaloscypha hepaticicola TaxID=2082293 RepID=A0A2J6PSR0_9HELO|nr:hypothetical protein NA56DRAFT_681373 [Hyaloscypha hepaticicola]